MAITIKVLSGAEGYFMEALIAASSDAGIGNIPVPFNDGVGDWRTWTVHVKDSHATRFCVFLTRYAEEGGFLGSVQIVD